MSSCNETEVEKDFLNQTETAAIFLSGLSTNLKKQLSSFIGKPFYCLPKIIQGKDPIEQRLKSFGKKVHKMTLGFTQSLKSYDLTNSQAGVVFKYILTFVVPRYWVQLSLLFCNFINTTANYLGRQEPSSPSTKELHGSAIQ